jgi:hypothetical protein
MRKHRVKKRSRRRRAERVRHEEIALANGIPLSRVKAVVRQFRESVAATEAAIMNNIITTLGRPHHPYESPYGL